MPNTAIPLVDHYLNGQRTAGAGRRYSDVFNPATGNVISRVRLALPEEAAAAVSAARAALPGWAATPEPERAQALLRFKDLVEQHQDELAACITREHGKVLAEARSEIGRGLEVIAWACGTQSLPGTACDDIAGDDLADDIESLSLRQALGVCAGITPSCMPLLAPLGMLAPALVAGNALVLKPSQRNPGAVLMAADLLREAGVPDGAFNIVQGDRIAVDALLVDPGVDALACVGSTVLADYVHRAASARGKQAQVLGGARNHLVVMPDANLEDAVSILIRAAFGSAGQHCRAIPVAVAVGDIADALVEALIPRVEGIVIGDGMHPDAQMGPLISAAHRARIEGSITNAVIEGARLVVDGRGMYVPDASNGFFTGTSLFDHVEPHMAIYRDEIFGPVLCIVRVPDLAAALDLINAHPAGRGAGICTGDGEAAQEFTRCARRLLMR